MTTRSWWVYPLQWGLWFVAMTAVMGWLARSRRAPAGADPAVLRYPASVLVIGAVATSLFGGLAILSLFSATGGLAVAAMFLLFALAGAYLAIDYFIASFRVTEDGIQFRVPLQGRGMIEWGQIRLVGWSQLLKWFLIHTTDGRTIRLPVTLYGLPVVASALLTRIEAGRFTTVARTLLLETAAGNPPSPWR
jgi:hypothetical protein